MEIPQKRHLPRRAKAPSKRLRDAYAFIAAVGLSDDQDVETALKQSAAEQWRQAMKEEIQSLTKMGVYEVVPKPPGVKPLRCKWVLKRKRTQQGHVERYKARLVAKGFTQRKGIDYDEVFASVVKHATVRAMLALAAVKDYDFEQIDVNTAFLSGPLDEEIYNEVPEEFDFGEDNVLMLKKALSGLK